ncbi:MAG: clostripain-related cysteine peptidase [Rikenellaceae bacterium]
MRRLLIYILFSIVFLSCSKEEEVYTPSDTPLERGAAEQVTLVYFMGTSLKYYYNLNISDAVDAVGGGALGQYGRLYYFIPSSSTKGALYELIQNEDWSTTKRLVSEFSNFPSINRSSLTEVITMVNDDVEWSSQSQTMNLMLSSHATGWVLDTSEAYSLRNSTIMISSDGGGVGYMPISRYMGASSDGVINISELEKSLSESGVNFGFLLFDACYMSSIEALYRLRDSADYIIASPCEVMGNGFPFERLLSQMFENNGRTYDLEGICDDYYTYYRDGYGGDIKSACVAVCVTSELENLAEAVRATTRESVNKSDIQGYSYYNIYPFYDLKSYIYHACSEDDYNNFTAQLELTFPSKYLRYTDSFFVSYYSWYMRDIMDGDLYSGVTTSEPVIYNNWTDEPWAIAVTISSGDED